MDERGLPAFADAVADAVADGGGRRWRRRRRRRRRRRSRGDRGRGRRRTLLVVAAGVAYLLYKTKNKGTKKVAPAKASKGAAFAAGAAAGAASGGGVGGVGIGGFSGPTLSAMEIDILGPLSGMLVALPAVAPPPLNMCLMPFAHGLAELGHAVRRVRFNKEAAALLQRRGVEIAQKLQDAVQATQACRRDRSRPSLGR